MRPLVLHIDDGKGEQRRIEIEARAEPLWLGRDASCDVVLPAPQVSRKHISLRLEGRHLQIEDHSANGTRVDDSVLRGAARRLNPGRCTVRVGPYIVSFEVPGEAASTGPARGNSQPARPDVAVARDNASAQPAHRPREMPSNQAS